MLYQIINIYSHFMYLFYGRIMSCCISFTLYMYLYKCLLCYISYYTPISGLNFFYKVRHLLKVYGLVHKMC